MGDMKLPASAFSYLRFASVLVTALFVFVVSARYMGDAIGRLEFATSSSGVSNSVEPISVPPTPVVETRSTMLEPRNPVAAPAPAAPETTVAAPASPPGAGTATPGVAALPAGTPSEFTHVATSAVNVRSGPSNGSAVVSRLNPGEEVQVTAEQGGWMQVSVNSVPIGWVFGRFLSRTN